MLFSTNSPTLYQCVSHYYELYCRCDEYKLTVLTTILCSYLHKGDKYSIQFQIWQTCSLTSKIVISPPTVRDFRRPYQMFMQIFSCYMHKYSRAFDAILRYYASHKIFEYFDFENVLRDFLRFYSFYAKSVKKCTPNCRTILVHLLLIFVLFKFYLYLHH